MKEWKKVHIFSSVVQVNVVIVPKQMHADKEVVKARLNSQLIRKSLMFMMRLKILDKKR